jgi:hypothetical protein
MRKRAHALDRAEPGGRRSGGNDAGDADQRADEDNPVPSHRFLSLVASIPSGVCETNPQDFVKPAS